MRTLVTAPDYAVIFPLVRRQASKPNSLDARPSPPSLSDLFALEASLDRIRQARERKVTRLDRRHHVRPPEGKALRWSDRLQDEVVLDEMPAPEVAAPLDILPELLNSDALTPASRAVLALHFQEELSLPEVAAILEIPLGTVKSRLAYGLAALRKKLHLTRSV